MIKQIGTKIYYCLLTGNVIKIIGDMQGYVKVTSFDGDYEIYPELKERDKETIGLLTFEYGEYSKISKRATGVTVDIETKELVFTYEELPEEQIEPTEIEVMQKKIKELEEGVITNMLVNVNMFEMMLAMSPVYLDINNIKGNAIINTYATLIKKKIKTIEDVPDIIKAQVEQELK